jgi:hypothetical protein
VTKFCPQFSNGKVVVSKFSSVERSPTGRLFQWLKGKKRKFFLVLIWKVYCDCSELLEELKN